MDNRSAAQTLYIVAVSGGVDSVVLLDILAQRVPAERLVVAHFDHGIRDDSVQDRLFVEALARSYGLRFVYGEAKLGPGASEVAARDARYGFLRRTVKGHGASHIITAHHQDDLLETAIINMLRGTGRKGLAALRSRDDLYRPLLPTPKAHILAYAEKYGLRWREDSTNANQDYLRNYVRQRIMPKFDAAARRELLGLIDRIGTSNTEIDGLLEAELQRQPGYGVLDREWFIMLPHAVAREAMAAWLRQAGTAGFDRKALERLTVAAKTSLPGKQIDINKEQVMVVSKDELRIVRRDGAS